MTPPAGDGTTQPGRILVVDDTAFNRQLLARLLRGIGHEPVEAEDGRRRSSGCATRTSRRST